MAPDGMSPNSAWQRLRSATRICTGMLSACPSLLGPLASIAAAASLTVTASAEQRPARGIIMPLQHATLMTDIGEPVARIPLRAGESFRRGDLLVSFDCRRQLAELSSAKARRKEMTLVLDSNTYLEKRQALALHDVAVSRARVEQVDAEVAALEVKVSRCQIHAPFDGRIAEIRIQQHETPSPGKPLISIVGQTDFEIMLIVPSLWLRWLKPGANFDFLVDETGAAIRAEIVRLGGQIDAVSQTLAIYGRFRGETSGILAGMSGRAIFAREGG